MSIDGKLYISQLILNFRSRAVIRDLKNVHELHRSLMKGFPQEGVNGQIGRKAMNLLFRLETNPKYGFKDFGTYGSRTIFYPKLIIQSTVKPDWSKLPADYLADNPRIGVNPIIKELGLDKVNKSINISPLFRFRLRANPSRKIAPQTDEEGFKKKKVNSKRVPIRNFEEQVKWLIRKGDQYGFKIVRLIKLNPEPPIHGYKDAEGDSKSPRSEARTESGDDNDGKNIGSADAKGGSKEKTKKYRLTIEGALYEGYLRVIDSEKFVSALIKGIGPGKSYGFGLLSIGR